MKRIFLLHLLLTSSLLAGEVAPASNVVGGLRRVPQLGASLRNVDGKTVVDAVLPGTSAEKIGLQAGDVVVSIDGAPVANAAAVVAAVQKKRAGDAMTVVVQRGGESVTKTATLVAKPLEHQDAYDIDYTSVTVNGSKRRAIVTKPHSAGKHPAVLLIGGIGCYSLDGLLRPADLTQAYAKILDALTRAGYVTMRVEKSGMGDSEGPPCNDPRSDFNAEVMSYAAGVKELEAYDFVDAKNVFLFAHSIGPLVAARLASEHPVRGIVVAETVGTSWIEYDLANTRRQLLLAGAPFDEVERAMRRHEVCAHRYYVEKQTPEQILAADKSCADDLNLPAPYTYLQQVGSLDLAALWKKIDAPVLIFYGTADFVTDDYQHQYLRDMINAFHPGRATYVKIEGMDHGFELAGSQKASFEGRAPHPFVDQVVRETLRFLESARG